MLPTLWLPPLVAVLGAECNSSAAAMGALTSPSCLMKGYLSHTDGTSSPKLQVSIVTHAC